MAFDLVCQGLIGKVNFKLQILNFKSKLKFKWKNYFVLITIFENIGESSLASFSVICANTGPRPD